MTTVDHIRRYKGDNGVRVDRKSIFGNPFKMKDESDRASVIKCFGTYFYGRLQMDAGFLGAVESLRGKVLLCWCSPKPCHADVIAEYLNNTEL
jgi:hypothetical protein